MNRLYGLFDTILDAGGGGDGPKPPLAQIHEIGVKAVEKALEPQPDEPRPAERVVAGQPDNERKLTSVD